MKFEIDQSGRVEFTTHDTVLADSSGLVVHFKKRDKQHLQSIYRLSGKPKIYTLEVFSALVALLISKKVHNSSDVYVIDLEYFGKDVQIRSLVKAYLRKMDKTVHTEQIQFNSIGKKSFAHIYAYEEFKRLKKRSKPISIERVLELTAIKKD